VGGPASQTKPGFRFHFQIVKKLTTTNVSYNCEAKEPLAVSQFRFSLAPNLFAVGSQANCWAAGS